MLSSLIPKSPGLGLGVVKHQALARAFHMAQGEYEACSVQGSRWR